MSTYCTAQDIQAYISNSEIVGFTDDDRDHVADGGLLDSIIATASNKVDALLSSVYQTPLNPIPAKAKDAAIVFSCFALYARRLTPDEKNPFKSQQDYWLNILNQIGSGQLPLDANIPKLVPPVGIVTAQPITLFDDNMF